MQTIFSFPTTIHFGPGTLEELPSVVGEFGCKKPLIVTDKGLANSKLIASIADRLGRHFETRIFGGVYGNPVSSQVTQGAKAYKDGKCDCIVAIGGGASLDVAKAIALMAHHPGHIFDYEDGKRDALSMDKEIPPIIAIPTTAGTGSEVGRSTVIADDVTHVKKIIFSPRLLAKVVIADPTVLLELPAHITAATGMDALTHLVESYLAKDYHPMCDGIALEGIRLIARSLVKSCEGAKGKLPYEEHLQARSDMMMAAMMGAVAFQKGLGVNHSCAHALSTVCDLHHGLANGIMLPACMKFNADYVPERFVTMAKTAGLQNETPEGFIAWLKDLQVETGTPQQLSAVGVSPSHLDQLVDFAYQDSCHMNNPQRVTKADLRHMFEQVM